MGLTRWILLGTVCLTAVGCASTDWEARYRDKERQTTELGADLESARHDSAVLQANNQVLTDQLNRLRQEKAGVLGELDALRAEMSQATTEPEATEPAVDIQALKQKMDFGDIRLDESGNVVITLESGITFSPGSANLSRSGRSILKRVTTTLRSDFPDRRIRLIGHTDSDPIKKSGHKDNWSLGFERARAVAVYFRDEARISEESLDLMSRGPHEPLASNETESGKKKNRRVEVVVVMPKAEMSAYR